MAQIISITQAKQKLLELARRNTELGEPFVVVRDSIPVSALIPFDEYESMLGTLDIPSVPIMSETVAMSKLTRYKGRLENKDGSTEGSETRRLLFGALFSFLHVVGYDGYYFLNGFVA